MDDDQRKPNQPRLKLDTTITGDPDAAPNPIPSPSPIPNPNLPRHRQSDPNPRSVRPATGNLSVLLRRSSEDPTGFHHTIRTSLTITPPRPINEETIEEDPLAVEDAIPAPTTTDASAGAGLGEGPSTVTIATSGPGTAITIPVSVPETLPGISTTAPALPLGALNPLPTCDLSSPHSPPIGSPSPLIRLLQGRGGNRFVGDSDPSTRDNSPSFTPAQQALQPPDDVRVTPSTLSLAPVEGASGTQETQQQERPRDSPWTLPFSPTPVQAPAVPFPEPTSSPWLDKAKPEEDPSDNSLTSPASRESRVSLAHRPRRSTAASSFLSQFTVPDPSPPSPDEEGQLIADDWIVGRDVGNGGFSIVKQGVRHINDQDSEIRAIKIVKRQVPNVSDTENELIQAALEHEVGIWRHLSHPHILPLDFVVEDSFATWCFMPLVGGGTLLELISQNRRRGIGMELARTYSWQLASALEYLHDTVGVIHRDIKPENCLLVGPNDDQVKRGGNGPPCLLLSDFGMAAWIEDDEITSVAPYGSAALGQGLSASSSATSVQRALNAAGTLEFSAPEKFGSDPEARSTPAVDVWAFGAVVYCCVTGNKPFYDPLEARVMRLITKGEWDRTVVLQGPEGAVRHREGKERWEALGVLEACLRVNPEERPRIAEVMEMEWFEGLGRIEGG